MIGRRSLLLSAALRPLGAQLLAPDRGSGWHSLFDGNSFAGWVEITGKPVPESCWKIEGGCLRAFATIPSFQDIRTVRSFRNFEFEWEWKLGPLGNSGVKYLIQNIEEWTNANGRQARARGFEYQLADNSGPDVNGDARRATASLYSLLAPTAEVPFALGVFNLSRIIRNGTHVEHWLNGTKVLKFETDAPEVAELLNLTRAKTNIAAIRTASPISLQNHGTDAWFRALRIREMPA